MWGVYYDMGKLGECNLASVRLAHCLVQTDPTQRA